MNVLGTLIFLVAIAFIAVQLWSQRQAAEERRMVAAATAPSTP